jgi:hydrogenase 3 maturation protease
MEKNQISNLCWPEAVKRSLNQLNVVDRPIRIVVVGVGQELRGDDAVGVYLARAIKSCPKLGSIVKVIDAGPAPENITGKLRRLDPDLVMIFDAAQMDEIPGSVRWLDWEQVSSTCTTSHTLPLDIFADYLKSELDCEVILIGIQPSNTALGSHITDEMYLAIGSILKDLSIVLDEFGLFQPCCGLAFRISHLDQERKWIQL